MTIERACKTALIKYGINKELELLVKINDLLNDNLLLIKTQDIYCCIDYKMMCDDELICYIELKSRRGIRSYDDLMIGATKLHNISKLDKPTLLLWIDGNDFYYCYFNNNFMKYKSGFCGSGAVIYIPKNELIIGDLSSFVSFLNQVNLQ